MSAAVALGPVLSKEIRALLPVWAACITALGAALFRRDGLLLDAAIVAYVAGPLALGAHSVGQEFTYRTLPVLLSQPADRRRVYRLKSTVVGAMVLVLAALAWGALGATEAHHGIWRHTTVQVLPLLGGLFVAPWMTMICRSSLAGMLLAGSVASLTFLLLLAATALSLGIGADAAQAMIVGPWSAAMIAFCIAAGVLGARRFRRLEAIDGPSASLHLPEWFARRTPRRNYRPARALLGKELHLQQLTFGIAVLFIFGSTVVSLLQRAVPSWADFPSGAVTLMYCMSLPVLIGALASAEERQHGTLESQMIQPLPAWQQWLVKVGVAFALALCLGAALPLLLIWFSPAPEVPDLPVFADVVLLVAVLTAGGLYVSSASTNGVRAMVAALPAGIATVLLLQASGRVFEWAGHSVDASSAITYSRHTLNLALAAPGLARATAAGACLLLLWFAFVNHRSSERSIRRVARQAAAIGLFAVLGMAAATVIATRATG